MLAPDDLTRDRFLEELRERLDQLRSSSAGIPERLDADVIAIVGASDNPFDRDLFRVAAAHLLEGLDPEMASVDGGAEILEERLAALPANLRLSLRVAAERHEQPV